MNRRTLHLFSLLVLAVLVWLAVRGLPDVRDGARAWNEREIRQAVKAAALPDTLQGQSEEILLAGARQIRIAPMLGAQPWTLYRTDAGDLRFIGMEPGWSAGSLNKNADVQTAARDFVMAWRDAFGLGNPRVSLAPLRSRVVAAREVVRLQQTYAELPVFSAQAIVHATSDREVTCVLLDAGHTFDTLDQMQLPLQPQFPAQDAAAKAKSLVQMRSPLADFDPAALPESKLVVYSPEVLGFAGDSELAWEVSVESRATSGFPASELVLISARDGAVLNRIERIHSALSRRVFDANFTTAAPATPTRDNGGAETNIAEVDNAYSFLTQIWAFYSFHHGRDSFNGSGATIDAIVQLRTAGIPTAAVPNPPPVPLRNANSGSGLGAMSFGEGFAADDVVGHEFTHKVTQYESGLLYQNASGAMNESFSDIWGEAFDQTNIGTVDPIADRWLVGEDIPLAAGDTNPNTSLNRALRSMSDPPAKGDPDRVRSAIFRTAASYPRGAPNSPDNNDNGGVHSNSGVGNKLFFLLVDGGSFNGRTITSIGSIELTPLDLFYEVQTNFLTPASDWRDLNFALRQAAINQGFSNALRTEVAEACEAVEIDLPPARTVFMDQATNAPNKVGIPEVNGSMGPYTTLAVSLDAAAGNVNEPDKGGGTIKIKGDSGRVVVTTPYTFSRPVTLAPYDTFIQLVPGSPAGAPPTGNPIPPVPVVIGPAP